jgi:hypothetical protein
MSIHTKRIASRHDSTIVNAAADRKSPISTVIDVLAGVARVAGQNRAVARANPTTSPSFVSEAYPFFEDALTKGVHHKSQPRSR